MVIRVLSERLLKLDSQASTSVLRSTPSPTLQYASDYIFARNSFIVRRSCRSACEHLSTSPSLVSRSFFWNNDRLKCHPAVCLRIVDGKQDGKRLRFD